MVRIGDEPDQHMLVKVTNRLDTLHREDPTLRRLTPGAGDGWRGRGAGQRPHSSRHAAMSDSLQTSASVMRAPLWLFTIGGRLRGSAGASSLRIIESHPDAHGVCNTGTVGFSATRLAGGPLLASRWVGVAEAPSRFSLGDRK